MIRNIFLCLLFTSSIVKLEANEQFKIMSGSSKGTYYKIAKSIKKTLLKNAKIIKSDGTTENIQKVQFHDADFGLVQLDILTKFASRSATVKKKVKVVFPIYHEELHILAPKKITDLNQIKKLANTSILNADIGPATSGSHGTAKILLHHMGLTRGMIKYNYSDSKKAIKLVAKHKVDFAVFVGGIPLKYLKKMKKKYSKKVHLLDVDDDIYSIFEKENIPYQVTEIPAKTYKWQKEEIHTISVYSALVVNNEVPDAVVEKLVKDAILKHNKLVKAHVKWKEFDLKIISRFALKNASLMHPAALRVIKSQKP